MSTALSCGDSDTFTLTLGPITSPVADANQAWWHTTLTEDAYVQVTWACTAYSETYDAVPSGDLIAQGIVGDTAVDDSTSQSYVTGGFYLFTGHGGGGVGGTTDLGFHGSGTTLYFAAGITTSGPEQITPENGAWSISVSGTIEVTCTPVPCTLDIDPAGRTISSDAQTGLTIDVTASDPGCEWTAVADDAWLTITYGSSGTGDDTILYDASLNDSGDERIGTITVTGDDGDHVHTVTQSECTLDIDPPTRSIPRAAQTGLTIAVTASDETCEWTAVADDDWLTITAGSSGTGSGTVTYDATRNDSGDTRVGTITVTGDDGDHVHTVTQSYVKTYGFASVVGAPMTQRSKRQAGFSFSQASPATVWTIDHNLGHIPVVIALDGSGNVLTGTVAYPSLNQATITFTSAQSGTAHLT